MKTILTVLITFNSILVFSQTSTNITNQLENKFTHTFFLGQPTNFSWKNDFEISAHYTFGFKNKQNKNREVQLGYRLTTFAPQGTWGYETNLQSFSLLYGGRRYFSTKKGNFKPYFNWHFGITVINNEASNINYFGLGNTTPLPVVDLGVYCEIGKRFDIGLTVEGLLPVAYFRLGYKLH